MGSNGCCSTSTGKVNYEPEPLLAALTRVTQGAHVRLVPPTHGATLEAPPRGRQLHWHRSSQVSSHPYPHSRTAP